MNEITIRPCHVGDSSEILRLIRELAVYEKLEEFAIATEDQLRDHLFGTAPKAEAVLAEWEGRAVGFALFFTTFSTFRGQPGIYLEDLFVEPEHRGRGIGKQLLGEVARIACERGCGRLEWSVLTWNTPAIEFYEAMGARPLNDWIMYRLDEQPLRSVGDARRGFTAKDHTPL